MSEGITDSLHCHFHFDALACPFRPRLRLGQGRHLFILSGDGAASPIDRIGLASVGGTSTSQHRDNDRAHARAFGPFFRAAGLMGGLPESVRALFDAASRSGIRVTEGKVQVMLFRGGWTETGGRNKPTEVRYVSRIIAAGRGATMRRNGFEFMDRTADEHRWLQRGGTDGADLTGDNVRGARGHRDNTSSMVSPTPGR